MSISISTTATTTPTIFPYLLLFLPSPLVNIVLDHTGRTAKEFFSINGKTMIFGFERKIHEFRCIFCDDRSKGASRILCSTTKVFRKKTKKTLAKDELCLTCWPLKTQEREWSRRPDEFLTKDEMNDLKFIEKFVDRALESTCKFQ